MLHCNALQPILAKLHVPFTSQTAKQLMRGEKGTAAQILYNIKSEVEKSADAERLGGSPTKLAATFGVKVPLSRGLLEANNYKYAGLQLQLAPRPVPLSDAVPAEMPVPMALLVLLQVPASDIRGRHLTPL